MGRSGRSSSRSPSPSLRSAPAARPAAAPSARPAPTQSAVSTRHPAAPVATRSAAPAAAATSKTAAAPAAAGVPAHAPAAHAPAAAPAASAPMMGGGGGFLSNVATIAAGSVAGHAVSNMLFGGRHDAPAAQAQEGVAEAAQPMAAQESAPCYWENRNYAECVERGADCHGLMEALQSCQRVSYNRYQ
eukprot:TRINITY_DN69_c0_g1_i1.p1 TRINITY_DN69_c0_g1~~TRINITY_DN69_c0_g1_i1.p1  ORF type:complete len:201 (-),score=42.08 TRINITY_DN69_c0_g1_i1:22-585(-)